MQFFFVFRLNKIIPLIRRGEQFALYSVGRHCPPTEDNMPFKSVLDRAYADKIIAKRMRRASKIRLSIVRLTSNSHSSFLIHLRNNMLRTTIKFSSGMKYERLHSNTSTLNFSSIPQKLSEKSEKSLIFS